MTTLSDKMINAHKAIMSDLAMGNNLPLASYEEAFKLPAGTLGEGYAADHYTADTVKKRYHW